MKCMLSLTLIATPLFAAFEYSGSDVMLYGASQSVIATDRLYSAYLLNPATSAAVEKYQLGLLYFKPYGISGVNYAGLISHFRIQNFGSGFTLSTFGNELYQEYQVVGNLARAFFRNRFLIGLNVRWNHLNVRNYFSSNSVVLDGGIQYILHPGILMAFSVLNITQPTLKPEEHPLVTHWGMAIRVNEKFDIYVSLQKDTWFPASLRVGIEARLNSLVTLHSGISSYPSVPSLGLSLCRNMIAFHYAFQYHFDLGGTHFWGVSLWP